MDRYFFFLFWSNLIFAISIFLFTNGFLKRRDVLPDRSQCLNPGGVLDQQCYPFPKQTSKAMVILIDALRYDFTKFNATLNETKPYQNAMPIISKLIQEGHGKLFESYADPPTTTMQRLKGITTGSIPTFIDVSSNFASYEINEDNLIDQLIQNGKKVVFAGDDTWMSLFPNRFTRSYPFPSFDVWDLDTVDRGVERHLYQELQRPNSWDVFIGHFLGVDHAGHKYGPSHYEMRRKLSEMNLVIEKIVKNLPQDCVLFVMGDHGMTASGDHGGDSEDELKAAMFIYSKNIDFKANGAANDKDRKISQIDFVPTLSLLLGLPIPFSNVGKLIYELFDVPNAGIRQLQYLKINIEQVFTYLTKYDSTSKLPQDTMKTMLEQKRYFMNNHSAINPNQVMEVMNFGLNLLSTAKQMCESTFVKFEDIWIYTSVFLMILHICFILSLTLPNIKLRSVINPKLLVFLMISIPLAFGLGQVSNNIANADELWLLPIYWVIIFIMYVYPVVRALNMDCSSGSSSSDGNLMNIDMAKIFHLIFLMVSCLSLFSNSYVVEEAHIYAFFLSSCIVLRMLKNGFLFNFTRTVIALGILALIRVCKIYFRCREEQQAYCEVLDFHKAFGTLDHTFSKSYGFWRTGSTFISTLLMVLLPWMWMKKCGNLNGTSFPVLTISTLPWFIWIAYIGNWALEYASMKHENIVKGLKDHKNLPALFVYVFSIFGVLMIIVKPHLTYYESKIRKHGKEIPKLNNDIAAYYQLMKSNWKDHFGTTTANGIQERKVTVYGLGTSISAAFLAMFQYMAFLSMLLLGDGLCPSVALIGIMVPLYLYLTSYQRLSKAVSLQELMHVPWSCVIGWSFLENLFFYATGHQPTFQTIQWNAAFTGFSGANFGTSELTSVLPAVLIGYNTFVSRILFAFFLPLLLVAPFAIHLTSTDESNKIVSNSNLSEILSQGETVLIEQRDETNANMFRLCVKYNVIQGMKLVSSMLTAAHHRRHLMVWKIFAPRFIFEGIGFLVSAMFLCLGYIVFIRVKQSLTDYVEELSLKKDK